MTDEQGTAGQEPDFDAQAKDEAVMNEPTPSPASQEIPPADPEKLWHHLNPKAILGADLETLTRAVVLFQALNGFGVSKNIYDVFPDGIKALFNGEALMNEDWIAAKHF